MMKLREAAGPLPSTGARNASLGERQPAHDTHPPEGPHPLKAQGAAGPQAAACRAPRQPVRLLSKAGRKGGVAAPLPGHPGVPDQHEQIASTTRSHELSLFRVASTYDVPWQQRREPLQVERSARVRTELRDNEAPLGDTAAPVRAHRRR
jgi:hypothetical protein